MSFGSLKSFYSEVKKESENYKALLKTGYVKVNGVKYFGDEARKMAPKNHSVGGVTFYMQDSQREMAEEMVESLSKIPTGRETLELIKKSDVCISFFEHTSLYYESEEEEAESKRKREAGIPEKKEKSYPDSKRIKALPKDGQGFMLYNTVLQAQKYKHEALESRPDFASEIVIRRAKRADSIVQALKACKEWNKIGETAPLQAFNEKYADSTALYDETNSLSDVYKAAFTDKEANNEGELFTIAGISPEMISPQEIHTYQRPTGTPVKPEEIAKYCGGDYVEGFNEFITSKEARQVQLLTKTILDFYVAMGGTNDPSIKDIPVLNLAENPEVLSLTQDNCTKLKNACTIRYTPLNDVKPTRWILQAVIGTVEKANKLSCDGKDTEKQEKHLKTLEKRMRKLFKNEPQKKNSLQSLLSNLGAKKTAQTVALKKDNSR